MEPVRSALRSEFLTARLDDSGKPTNSTRASPGRGSQCTVKVCKIIRREIIGP